ncbi:MAG: SpoIIIAH-like family protein, partial [Ruminococcus sp.]|nr:SpoIIIAH-like family protein [Ruminococcus sp.]
MKKPTLIIGKKHIIMSCLTLMLAVAVYINYAAVPLTNRKKPEKKKSQEETISYGETEFVNASADSATDYFAQARLDKMNNRDEAVQTLQMIIGGGDIT